MKVIGIIALAAVFLTGALSLLFNPQTPRLVYEAARSSVSEIEREASSASVYFLGDVMLARDVERRLQVQASDHAFRELAFLKGAAAVVANFEASVPAVHEPTPDLAMKFSVATPLLPTLKAGDVTHLSLANNHALDHGEEGYVHTLFALEAHDLGVFGHPTRLNESSITYLEAGGQKFAIVGINATYGIVPETWTKLLADATLQSDVQIAYVHWGEEYVFQHNETQEKLAHLWIDAGFELVIGHHPHVVQDVESYRGGLIFYSLGNFIFDQYWNDDVQTGLILELSVAGKGMSVVLHPVESKTEKVQPRLMIETGRQSFLQDLAARSSPGLREDIAEGRISLQF